MNTDTDKENCVLLKVRANDIVGKSNTFMISVKQPILQGKQAIGTDKTPGMELKGKPTPDKQFYYLVEIEVPIDEDGKIVSQDSYTLTRIVECRNSSFSVDEMNQFNIDNEKEVRLFFEKNNQVKYKTYTLPETLVMENDVWNLLCLTMELGKYPLLLGPKGCGKSQAAQAIAEAMELEYYTINAGSIFKPKTDLIGTMQVKDGDTVVIESEFLRHYTSAKPTVIFIDELTRVPQQTVNYLMTALDRLQNYLYVPELGRRVYKGENVKVIAAGNVGMEYTDTRTIDGAFWDRFIKIPVDYLPEDKEIALIAKRCPGANLRDIKILVNHATKCRAAQNNTDASGETLHTGVSTRQLLDMASYLAVGVSIKQVTNHIFKNIFINGNFDDRETFIKIIGGGSKKA